MDRVSATVSEQIAHGSALANPDMQMSQRRDNGQRARKVVHHFDFSMDTPTGSQTGLTTGSSGCPSTLTYPRRDAVGARQRRYADRPDRASQRLGPTGDADMGVLCGWQVGFVTARAGRRPEPSGCADVAVQSGAA